MKSFFRRRDFQDPEIDNHYYVYLKYYRDVSDQEREFPVSVYFGREEVAFFFRGVIGGEFISQKIMSWPVAPGEFNQKRLSETIENYWRVNEWPSIVKLNGIRRDEYLCKAGYAPHFHSVSDNVHDRERIDLRELILDFLFEMDRTEIFSEHPNFSDLKIVLQANSVLNALSRYGTFRVEEDESGDYQSVLYQAFYDWLNICINIANKDIFESPNSVFRDEASQAQAGPLKEIVSTPKSMSGDKEAYTDHREEVIEQILRMTVFDDGGKGPVKGFLQEFGRKESDPRSISSISRMINALKLLKRWFFLRYDLGAAERIFWEIEKLETLKSNKLKGSPPNRCSVGQLFVNIMKPLYYVMKPFYYYVLLPISLLFCIVNVFTANPILKLGQFPLNVHTLMNLFAVGLVGGAGVFTFFLGGIIILKRRIGFFRLAILRLLGGIIIGHFGLFSTDEAWAFVEQCPLLELVVLCLLIVAASFIYVFAEINSFISDRKVASRRACQIVRVGLSESFIVGLLAVNLFGTVRLQSYSTEMNRAIPGGVDASLVSATVGEPPENKIPAQTVLRLRTDPVDTPFYREANPQQDRESTGRLFLGSCLESFPGTSGSIQGLPGTEGETNKKEISNLWICHLNKKIGGKIGRFSFFIFLPVALLWTPLALFVGIFFQLLWQDKPITEPL